MFPPQACGTERSMMAGDVGIMEPDGRMVQGRSMGIAAEVTAAEWVSLALADRLR